MRASGHHKPIWATETAYYAVDDAPWTPWLAPPGHFSAGLLLPSERTAADYLVRHAIISSLTEPGRSSITNPSKPGQCGAMDIENTFLGPDAVPKKSYTALAALANLLGPSPVYAGRFPAAAGAHTYGFAFQCGGRAVLAAWVARQKKNPSALRSPSQREHGLRCHGEPADRKKPHPHRISALRGIRHPDRGSLAGRLRALSFIGHTHQADRPASEPRDYFPIWRMPQAKAIRSPTVNHASTNPTRSRAIAFEEPFHRSAVNQRGDPAGAGLRRVPPPAAANPIRDRALRRSCAAGCRKTARSAPCPRAASTGCRR